MVVLASDILVEPYMWPETRDAKVSPCEKRSSENFFSFSSFEQLGRIVKCHHHYFMPGAVAATVKLQYLHTKGDPCHVTIYLCKKSSLISSSGMHDI